jgi:hypothetical protein
MKARSLAPVSPEQPEDPEESEGRVQLNIRFNRDQIEKVDANASKAGLGRADFMRELAVSGVLPFDPKQLTRIIEDLKGLARKVAIVERIVIVGPQSWRNPTEALLRSFHFHVVRPEEIASEKADLGILLIGQDTLPEDCFLVGWLLGSGTPTIALEFEATSGPKSHDQRLTRLFAAQRDLFERTECVSIVAPPPEPTESGPDQYAADIILTVQNALVNAPARPCLKAIEELTREALSNTTITTGPERLDDIAYEGIRNIDVSARQRHLNKLIEKARSKMGESEETIGDATEGMQKQVRAELRTNRHGSSRILVELLAVADPQFRADFIQLATDACSLGATPVQLLRTFAAVWTPRISKKVKET